MSLGSVKISEEVWLACVTHALTTETEEIMGLLLGDIQLIGGIQTAVIWAISPQMRSDRRKDRVETNPEQLAAASAQAEIMTATTGRTTRVIGWYHSHPRHTVLPSHVDVRTQAMYQLLDPGFIGLIFSCFGEDAQKVGRIQVIAFQSLDGKQKNASPVCNSSIVDLETSWSSSETALTESMEQDTGDSKLSKGTKVGEGSPGLEELFSHLDVNNLGKQRMRGPSLVQKEADIDSPDLASSMQVALHRSNMDLSGAEYVRKEVQLQVLPAQALLQPQKPLTSFTAMQHVLFEEEQSAYKSAIAQNMQKGKIHPLTYVHHVSTYQASLCKLMEYCLSPAVVALQDRQRENEIRLGMLNDEAETLALEIREREVKLGSPRGLGSPRIRGRVRMNDSGDSAYDRSPSRRKAS